MDPSGIPSFVHSATQLDITSMVQTDTHNFVPLTILSIVPLMGWISHQKKFINGSTGYPKLYPKLHIFKHIVWHPINGSIWCLKLCSIIYPINDSIRYSKSDITSFVPSQVPYDILSMIPSDVPSSVPSNTPSFVPLDIPSDIPSITLSFVPSLQARSWKTSKSNNRVDMRIPFSYNKSRLTLPTHNPSQKTNINISITTIRQHIFNLMHHQQLIG